LWSYGSICDQRSCVQGVQYSTIWMVSSYWMVLLVLSSTLDLLTSYYILSLTESTNVCMSCGITFAEWHCAKCNLWMDLSKRPFHCDKCGICRVGGRDKFQHCEQCCMCISTTMLETHNCIKDKYKSELIITFYTVIVGCRCVLHIHSLLHSQLPSMS
jgi:hypothetical protein